MKFEPNPTTGSAPIRIEEPLPTFHINPLPIHCKVSTNPLHKIETFPTTNLFSLNQIWTGLFFKYLTEISLFQMPKYFQLELGCYVIVITQKDCILHEYVYVEWMTDILFNLIEFRVKHTPRLIYPNIQFYKS